VLAVPARDAPTEGDRQLSDELMGGMMIIKIGLLLMSVWCWSAPAQAATYWDDELESGNTGYTLPTGYASTPMTFDTTVKFSGAGSLRYNFDAVCYPDAAAQTNCGGFSDRLFTNTGTFWRRFYIRVSSGFTWSDVYTKLMRSDTTGPNSNWWGFGMWGNGTFFVTDQNVPAVGASSNIFTSYTMPKNQWVCLETYEQLNTPGVANGVQQAWADGVQILNRTDIQYRQTGDNSLFANNRLYRQTGLGSIWLDRLAVGNARIGCLGGTIDTTPPAPVINLRVTELWEALTDRLSLAWQWIIPSDAQALTNASATLSWQPTTDATIRYELRWKHFANGWAWEPIAANLDSTTGTYAQTFSALPETTGDRGACWDARAVRGSLASPWLSESGQQRCVQMPVGTVSPDPVPLPTPSPVPPPVPAPVHDPVPAPVPVPPATVTMSGDKVFIACDPTRYTRALTTGTGTKRTITCKP